MPIIKKPNQRILVLSPHTDDAELGCGGSISRLLEEGNQILWIVFSTAKTSLPKGLPDDTLKKEFCNVCSSLKLDESCYKILDYDVRKLQEDRQEILERMVEVNRNYKPTLVIGPSINDHHQDHCTIAQEMVRAFKRGSSVICYELPWNHTTFSTQMFIRLTKKQVDKKIALLRHYPSQKLKNREYFSDEFIKGLAKVRGVQINSSYAEAFEVIRWVL